MSTKEVRLIEEARRMKDEPAYMLAARGDVRSNAPSSPVVVKALLERIERLESEISRRKVAA